MTLMKRLHLKWTRIHDHHLIAKPQKLSGKMRLVVATRKLAMVSSPEDDDVPALMTSDNLSLITIPLYHT